MQIIKKVMLDLAREGLPIRVAAVRGDSALWLEFDLYSSGEPFVLPTDAAVMIRYRLPAGTGGEYDTVSGVRAWQTEGNLLRVAIASAVCSQAGDTALQVAILQGGRQISTVPVVLAVAPAVSGSGAPENYTNLSQWLKFNTGNAEVSLGELESRVIAVERALAAHAATVHLTQEDVREMIDDPWGIPTYAGEMEDV